MKRSYCLLLLAFLFACRSSDSEAAGTEQQLAPQGRRIISLSGLLTEVLFELGYGEQIVGVDVTSSYPEGAVDAIPKLGHISRLNAEAILQLQPDIIFVEAAGRSQEVLDQLAAAGVRIAAISTGHQLFNAVTVAHQMAGFLDVEPGRIAQMQQKIEQDSLALQANLSQYQTKPKVLFIYARGIGRLSVGGANTAAAVIIERAGGKNAITAFDDFQVLTPEALVEAAPDVILMFSSGLASLDGVAGLSRVPGMDQTPAYRNRRVVAMDGHYLTAFGPRAAAAALELAGAIHSEAVQ